MTPDLKAAWRSYVAAIDADRMTEAELDDRMNAFIAGAQAFCMHDHSTVADDIEYCAVCGEGLRAGMRKPYDMGVADMLPRKAAA